MNPSPLRKPLLMGVLNVTPDSFSDGGLHSAPEAALAQARKMAAEGADIIDIGGESTRPGAGRTPAEEQLRRVVPVFERLLEMDGEQQLSIDTTSARVAAEALEYGATMINDISAGRDDPAMFKLIAAAKVPCVLMHMQGDPATMQERPRYDDVVEEIRAFLLARAKAAQDAGVEAERIVIDPGIGFGKTRQDNLALIAGLGRFTDSGYPVLLGASRKRFMGAICEVEHYRELVGATCATTAMGALAGVSIFRVHDVKENRQALDVAWAVRNAAS